MKYVVSFSSKLLSAALLTLKIIYQNIVINERLHVEYSLSSDVHEILKYQIMKICPVGAALFHADRQMARRTDRHNEANRFFMQFS
jgi:hypothetical protein